MVTDARIVHSDPDILGGIVVQIGDRAKVGQPVSPWHHRGSQFLAGAKSAPRA